MEACEQEEEAKRAPQTPPARDAGTRYERRRSAAAEKRRWRAVAHACCAAEAASYDAKAASSAEMA